MTIRGTITNGVVVLDGSVRLPEGTAVLVQALDQMASQPGDDALYDLANLAVPTGIPDLALNIDHYLYGHPKVTDAE